MPLISKSTSKPSASLLYNLNNGLRSDVNTVAANESRSNGFSLRPVSNRTAQRNSMVAAAAILSVPRTQIQNLQTNLPASLSKPMSAYRVPSVRRKSTQLSQSTRSNVRTDGTEVPTLRRNYGAMRLPNVDTSLTFQDDFAPSTSISTGVNVVKPLRSTVRTLARTSMSSKRSIIPMSLGRKKSSGYKIESSVQVVMNSSKHLPKILRYLNWNELGVARCVCKKWFKICCNDPALSEIMGYIGFQTVSGFLQSIASLSTSSSLECYWKKFRINIPVIYDMTNSIQAQFWNQFGPSMTHLEIDNRTMTLSGLVEILDRCRNLTYFSVAWSPEMYSFNSELIKKYYRINFRNGTFSQLRKLHFKRSSFVTDNALWSFLKWCGPSLRSLSLVGTSDDFGRDEILHRLKPRWSVDPFINYSNAFGSTGGIRELDFSYSNFSHEDLTGLADLQKFPVISSLKLSHCTKIDDSGLDYYITKKGHQLENLDLEFVPLTCNAFLNFGSLPNLRSLNISGPLLSVDNLDFLHKTEKLVELHISNTPWLDFQLLMQLLKKRPHCFRILNASGTIRLNKAGASKQIDLSTNKEWFGGLCHLLAPTITSLDLSYWTQFGNNENFKIICETLSSLEILKIRGWKNLNDTGITGISTESMHRDPRNKEGLQKAELKNETILRLQALRELDLSDCDITDNSIRFGISGLRNLRILSVEGTNVTEHGITLLISKTTTIDKISAVSCRKIQSMVKSFQRSDGRTVKVKR